MAFLWNAFENLPVQKNLPSGVEGICPRHSKEFARGTRPQTFTRAPVHQRTCGFELSSNRAFIHSRTNAKDVDLKAVG